MKKEFGAINQKNIDRLRTDPYFEKVREAVIKRAGELDSITPPHIKFSEMHLFVTTGDRATFSRVFGFYESAMQTYYLAYLITQDEKYLTPLADYIWNICDYESWSIPAHVDEKSSIEWRRRSLDLVSTNLAANLAQIISVVGDKLPELVSRRASVEIRYRMIESFAMYDEKDYDWMVRKTNWSAVCIAGVFATYIFAATDEEIKAQLPRMIRAAECYLMGFADDGCCSEGCGYWNYGFSYFCLFASMLREYTCGEVDFFKQEKVHKIALFQQNVMMNNSQVLSFSDGNLEFKPHVGLTHFLKKEYPDIVIPPTDYPSSHSPNLFFLLWQDGALKDGDDFTPRSHYFEDTQWYLNHKSGYTLGAKAGHNAEQHNQNDVGSFMISKGGRVTFVDPGSAEYTRDYFRIPIRYEIFVCSSRGHSVPIINGEYQVMGKRPATVDAHDEDRFAFNMELAYEIPTLKKLYRDFTLGDKVLTLTDTYSFTEQPLSVTERFVAILPIEGGEGELRCADSVLHYDPNLFTLEISTEQISRGGGRVDTAYVADLKVIEPKKDMTLVFTFE